jgi:hypothetical protein
MPAIFKAVIPAAGRGVRMRPLSLTVPKEMILVGRKPMIQMAVEEAAGAEIRDICIVIRRGKEVIRDYLLRTFPASSCSSTFPKLTFVYQHFWDGLGGALRATRSFVGPDLFLMIIPDQFLRPAKVSASRQLISHYRFETPVVLSSIVKIPGKELNYFSGSRGFEFDVNRLLFRGPFPITSLQMDTAQAIKSGGFELRGFGRTIFPSAIFNYLRRRFINPENGEIDLYRTFLKFPDRIPHWGCLLRGGACDLGTLDGCHHYRAFFNA